MAADKDERTKLSWKEIDARREKKSSREPGGRPDDDRLSRSNAYRSYKTQLNKLFDGGGVPQALKEKLSEAGVGNDVKAKKEAEAAILSAKTAKEIKGALAAALENGGFPENEEVLAKLLDLEDEEIVLRTTHTLSRILAEGGLKRAASLKARLKTAEMTLDAPEVQQAIRELLKKL